MPTGKVPVSLPPPSLPPLTIIQCIGGNFIYCLDLKHVRFKIVLEIFWTVRDKESIRLLVNLDIFGELCSG